VLYVQAPTVIADEYYRRRSERIFLHAPHSTALTSPSGPSADRWGSSGSTMKGGAPGVKSRRSFSLDTTSAGAVRAMGRAELVSAYRKGSCTGGSPGRVVSQYWHQYFSLLFSC